MKQTPDEIFDDANVDLSVCDLDSAVEKVQALRADGAGFFRWLARTWHGPDETRAF